MWISLRILLYRIKYPDEKICIKNIVLVGILILIILTIGILVFDFELFIGERFRIKKSRHDMRNLREDF